MSENTRTGSEIQLTRHAQIGSETEFTGNFNYGNDIKRSENVGEEEVDIGFKDHIEAGPVTNVYVGKRNFIHQMMDVALLMANVSQLKALLSIPTTDKYYVVLFFFIVSSITLQVVFTICMLIIWSIEKKIEDHLQDTKKKYPEDDSRKKIGEYLDKLCNVIVLLIIVSNVFITGFGVESHDSQPPPT